MWIQHPQRNICAVFLLPILHKDCCTWRTHVSLSVRRPNCSWYGSTQMLHKSSMYRLETMIVAALKERNVYIWPILKTWTVPMVAWFSMPKVNLLFVYESQVCFTVLYIRQRITYDNHVFFTWNFFFFLIEWTERCVKIPGENVTHTLIFKWSESVPLLLSAIQNKSVLWIDNTFTVLSIKKCWLYFPFLKTLQQSQKSALSRDVSCHRQEKFCKTSTLLINDKITMKSSSVCVTLNYN